MYDTAVAAVQDSSCTNVLSRGSVLSCVLGSPCFAREGMFALWGGPLYLCVVSDNVSSWAFRETRGTVGCLFVLALLRHTMGGRSSKKTFIVRAFVHAVVWPSSSGQGRTIPYEQKRRRCRVCFSIACMYVHRPQFCSCKSQVGIRPPRVHIGGGLPCSSSMMLFDLSCSRITIPMSWWKTQRNR